MRTGGTAKILQTALVFVALTACGDTDTQADASAQDATVQDVAPDVTPDATAEVCERWVLDENDEVINGRDVGGAPLDEGYRVACGQLYRGGDLARLTEGKGCTEFATLNIATIVDTRASAEASATVNAACATSATETVILELPKLLPDSPENYIALLDETTAIRLAFQTLGDSDSYPVYMHCITGRDRTSVISALVLAVLGASRETIMADFELSEQADVAVKPPSMEALLDEVEQRGGAEQYLKDDIGITDAEIAVLRTQLRVAAD